VANDPMKQFEIKKILELPQIAGQDISFTNSSLWMVVGILLKANSFLDVCNRLVNSLMNSLPIW